MAASVALESRVTLTPVVGVSRQDAVISEVRRRIVLGLLAPGERLVEADLASSLEISKATVRGSLNLLAHDGLIVFTPHRGFRVATLSVKELHDLAQARVALDTLAARDIVADPTGYRLQLVRVAWARFERALRDPDALVRHEEHIAFHQAIWAATDNVVLNQLWPVIQAKMTIALSQDQAARPRADRAHRMHLELVEAFETGELSTIEKTLTDHTLISAGEFLALTVGRLP